MYLLAGGVFSRVSGFGSRNTGFFPARWMISRRVRCTSRCSASRVPGLRSGSGCRRNSARSKWPSAHRYRIYRTRKPWTGPKKRRPPVRVELIEGGGGNNKHQGESNKFTSMMQQDHSNKQ